MKCYIYSKLSDFFPKKWVYNDKIYHFNFLHFDKKIAQQNYHAQISQYCSSFTISLFYDTYKPQVLTVTWTKKWITCKKEGPTTMMQCPRAIQWLKTTRQWLWNEGKKAHVNFYLVSDASWIVFCFSKRKEWRESFSLVPFGPFFLKKDI
jgi:hypothetical protein